MNIQRRCLDLLAATGMTQAALAEASGIDKGDLSKLLRSDSSRLTFRRVLQLAEGLGATPEELLEGVDEIDERLRQDLDFWLGRLGEGLAARRDLVRLQRTLEAARDSVGQQLSELEARHGSALAQAREATEAAHRARDEMRRQRDGAADQAGAARLREARLAIERDQLRLDLQAARASAVELEAEVARLRSELARTKVTGRALAALFGEEGAAARIAGAGAPGRAEFNVEED